MRVFLLIAMWAGLALPRIAAGQPETVPAEFGASAPSSSAEYSAYAYFCIVPDSREYLNPIITADRDWLHLEARYNYEALETGSLWAGYNFHFGETVTFDASPMVGGVFGDLTGVAPGYAITFGYKGFQWYGSGEYFIDAGDRCGNFFYTWTELTYSFAPWLRAGLVITRTKAYKSDLDIQRGFLVGTSYKNADFTAYVLNLGWEDPTFILAAGFNF